MRQLLWAAGCVLAVGLPLALLPSVGLPETWEAFDRYSSEFLAFPESHVLRVPKHPGAAPNSYTALDADLVAWHLNASRLYSRCSSMAVVGLMGDADTGMQFTFDRAAGSGTRSLKQGFYAPRDLSILAYLLLSILAYSSRSVPLALLVLTLNAINLSICMHLKLLTDSLSVAVDQLTEAEQDFLLLPLEEAPERLALQQALLLKLQAISRTWSSSTFCYSITVPAMGSLSVSISLMASLAAATSARCFYRILKGVPPELRALLAGRRRMQGTASNHGKKEQ